MKLFSHSSVGFEGNIIHVEVDIRKGIPGVDIVGLPDSAVKEAKERVRIAIKNTELEFPTKRILINLAPADIKKVGSCFDLSIALGILTISKQLKDLDEALLVMGELSLSGEINWVPAIFSAILAGKERGIKHFIVPKENAKEASYIDDVFIWPLSNLKELPLIYEKIELILKNASLNFIEKKKLMGFFELKQEDFSQKTTPFNFDFKDLKGQASLKRALEIAVAGRHNILLAGPPGSGKTMAIKCIESILPPLSKEEAIEVTRIWSIAGKIAKGHSIIFNQPFRHPHHSSSLEGLIGGGSRILPGEISLAHRGVLFLDEVLEFKKNILQSLREPIEDHKVNIVRAGLSYTYPSRFQLMMTSNLCPCGNLGKLNDLCVCSSQEIHNYWKKLGGALLDRIDIRVKVIPVKTSSLFETENLDSKTMKNKIIKAMSKQKNRYKNTFFRNQDLSASQLEFYAPLKKGLSELLSNVTTKLHISSRATHSIIKVARTIADLNEHNFIEKEDILEAIQHRRYAEDLDEL